MAFTDAKEPDNPIVFANDSFLSLTARGIPRASDTKKAFRV
jgi:hypothetical protein